MTRLVCLASTYPLSNITVCKQHTLIYMFVYYIRAITNPGLRVYLGNLPIQLWVIHPDSLLDLMFPVRAEPHDGVLTRPHNEQREHLTCSRQSINQSAKTFFWPSGGNDAPIQRPCRP